MAKAEWTQAAAEDLDSIYLYIAREARRPRVAKNVDQAIREHCDKYATLTSSGNLLGTDCSDLRPGVRSFTHQRWVILFRPVNETIRVLAVFDGSREYAELFKQRREDNE